MGNPARLLRPVFLLLVIALSACDRPVESPTAEVETPRATVDPAGPPAVPAPAQVASLAGEWRVAGIDGRSFDEPYALSLTGDADQLWWEPRCAGFARSYQIEGAGVDFGPAPAGPPAGSSPPPVCAIAAPPRLGEIFRALDEADAVIRTDGNGVLISGPDHSVTLFSQ